MVIEVDRLKRHFKSSLGAEGFFNAIRALFFPTKKIKKAVDGISFKIDRGEFVGFVGENGAGKSTTIKTLTGILTPTSGSARVAGLVPWLDRKANARNIGVVFGQRTQLWWDLPVKESFELLRAIYRIDEKVYFRLYHELRERLDLDEALQTPARNLSLGLRMRCDIAASLLHNPKVLFLDEPTIGLDLLAKDQIRAFLTELNRESKTTILLTTHDMEDIETLCERIIMLDSGRIIFDGSRSSLTERYLTERVIEVEFKSEPTEIKIPEARVISTNGRKARLAVEITEDSIPRALARLIARDDIKDIAIHQSRVADVVKKIYADKETLKPKKPEPFDVI